MNDLAALGLEVRTCFTNSETEQRTEMRLVGSRSFVAWFQKNMRKSNGEVAVSTNSQIVRRAELTNEQLSAIRAWLHGLYLSAI